MRRRTVLACCAGLTAGLAGCGGILGSSDGGSGDPAAVAESFVEALFTGDAETANDLLHDEAAIDRITESDLEDFRERELRVEETEVVSQQDGAATVAVTTNGEIAMTAPGESATVRVLLRRQGGEWRVLTVQTPSFGGGGSSAPSVQWDSTSMPNDDDAVTDVVFVHEGGETVEFGRLSAAVGDSFAAPTTTGEVTAGSRVVVPFDDDGDAVTSGTTVELRWTNVDTGEDRVLATHTLRTDAAGSLAGALRLES